MSWDKHPDPQLQRNKWFSLNGDWLLNGRRIQVPFAPESEMSAFKGEIGYGESESLVYEKNFVLPEYMHEGKYTRLLLHVDGVDQRSLVAVNGKVVGSHRDGYLKAVYDVTGKVKEEGENLLKIIAVDHLSKDYPYGKQKIKRGGMWYTPFSGVWKSVWLEAVPSKYIKGLRTDWDGENINFKFNFSEFLGRAFEIRISGPSLKNETILKADEKLDEETEENWIISGEISENIPESGIKIPAKELVSGLGDPFEVKLWSPEEPWLYDAEITAGDDVVKTYFGLRTVEEKVIDGRPKVLLNGKAIFLHGVLDQGYYEKSLVLPPEEEEYERDVLRMKKLGFNLLRKHVKTESDWFYYYCDIHGMLVMQDFVNSGNYRYLIDTVLPTIGLRLSDDRWRYVGIARRKLFEIHAFGVVDELHNHPCVVAYTIFNEGWGQHRGDDHYAALKAKEPGRLFDTASGWFDVRRTDFDSRHIYFRLRNVKPSKRYRNKPIFITECGGYSWAVDGHIFNPKKAYGYGKCNSVDELTGRIEELYEKMVLPGIGDGVCGCIYTQLSDIEDEVNGLYTYDRQICKVDEKRMKALALRLAAEVEEK
ncbi:MAG: hypothetical protein K6G60_04230 [Lachnospiraceae bacterium]|nr:hypothetical protein [Lachnospiraceae bacterium]